MPPPLDVAITYADELGLNLGYDMIHNYSTKFNQLIIIIVDLKLAADTNTPFQLLLFFKDDIRFEVTGLNLLYNFLENKITFNEESSSG